MGARLARAPQPKTAVKEEAPAVLRVRVNAVNLVSHAAEVLPPALAAVVPVLSAAAANAATPRSKNALHQHVRPYLRVVRKSTPNSISAASYILRAPKEHRIKLPTLSVSSLSKCDLARVTPNLK
jgi:hypothetical protein